MLGLCTSGLFHVAIDNSGFLPWLAIEFNHGATETQEFSRIRVALFFQIWSVLLDKQTSFSLTCKLWVGSEVRSSVELRAAVSPW